MDTEDVKKYTTLKEMLEVDKANWKHISFVYGTSKHGN